MKKIISVLFFAGVILVGASSAYAVPTINGTLGAGEWDNTGYNYYLNVSDPNEAGVPDNYDIKSVTLLQELEGFGFGDTFAANDGIYLLIETYATPPSFVDVSSGGPKVTVYLSGDFNGDGIFDFEMEHTALADGTGQTVTITSSIFGVTGDLVANGGSFSSGTVLEYFIPSAGFNTPNAPFPGNFIGKIAYDNGGTPDDDEVVGTLIPEPSSMLLFGGALLGMLGIRSRKK